MSVLRLHTLTPWAMHSSLDVIVPVLSDGALHADLARDRVALDKGQTCDDTGLPHSLAVLAVECTLVDFIATSIASPGW